MKTLNGNHTGNPRFLIYTVGTTASDLTGARTASDQNDKETGTSLA